MIGQLTRNWWVFVLQGVLAIGIGVAAFAAPGATLTAFVAIFAAYAIVSGAFGILAGLGVPNGPSWSLVLGGIAGVVVGAIAIASPDTTAVAAVYLVAIYAIVTGVAQLAAAFTLGRYTNMFLLGLSGVVSVAFGVLLISAPGDGVLAVLWLIGFYAVFAGVMYIATGLRLRQVDERIKSLDKPATSAGDAASAA
jgi:uncharacterized membrane protein HdeD (DUF308 family)